MKSCFLVHGTPISTDVQVFSRFMLSTFWPLILVFTSYLGNKFEFHFITAMILVNGRIRSAISMYCIPYIMLLYLSFLLFILVHSLQHVHSLFEYFNKNKQNIKLRPILLYNNLLIRILHHIVS